MTDTATPKKRSQIMSKVKSGGNKSTELTLIRFFKKYGIKGWRRNYPLFGKPDFVFPKSRLAIFIDGCFWHGCQEHCRIPKTNTDYWVNKINRNIKRDKLVNCELKKKQWNVFRIWEHELRKENYKEKLKLIKKIIEQDALPKRYSIKVHRDK